MKLLNLYQFSMLLENPHEHEIVLHGEAVPNGPSYGEGWDGRLDKYGKCYVSSVKFESYGDNGQSQVFIELTGKGNRYSFVE